jgi:hypothetical protein
MKLKMITLAAAAAAAFSTAPAMAAAPPLIDFENSWSYGAPIDEFYASSGVSFTNFFGLSNNDGLGGLAGGDYYAGAPSPLGTAYVSAGAFMNVAAGVENNLSFFYSTPVALTGAVKAWSGLNGSGSLLGTFDFGVTDSAYSVWQQAAFSFTGTALSFDFSGAELAGLDNISAVPEPETFALLLAGLGLVAASVRRQQKKSV